MIDTIKKHFSIVITLITSISVIGSGFYAYGMFENRLVQLETREYVITQEVDLEPVYNKIEMAKDLFREKLGESNRVWNTDSARITDNISDNKTNIEVLKKEIELLKLKIEEIELQNSNPLAR